jgi:hypothetical protein
MTKRRPEMWPFAGTSEAGETGLEPATPGFGDRCTTNCATPLRSAHCRSPGRVRQMPQISAAGSDGPTMVAAARGSVRVGVALAPSSAPSESVVMPPKRRHAAGERATGIEPALEAWKASVQPQHFARECLQLSRALDSGHSEGTSLDSAPAPRIRSPSGV